MQIEIRNDIVTLEGKPITDATELYALSRKIQRIAVKADNEQREALVNALIRANGGNGC